MLCLHARCGKLCSMLRVNIPNFLLAHNTLKDVCHQTMRLETCSGW